MAKKIKFSSLRWVLQGGLLIVSFVAVIVSIRSLRDPGQKLNLDEIFEDHQAIWDWCPEGKDLQIEFLPATGAGLPVAADDVCEVVTQAVRTEQTQGAAWVPLLRAQTTEPKAELMLEGDLSRGIFRAQGLPFYSPMLQEHLKALSSP